MTRISAPWLISDASQAVCAMLTDAGFDAWFVGGCVRNALIDAPVADLDLSTNARPEMVIELAERAGLRVIPTGIEHGTVTVMSDGAPYEITTFRKDVATDGRRAVVAFSDDIAEDARRRDFTMNALYAGPDGVVVDPLGGLPDLHARRVRFIDDAEMRIKEDYLRILRFFRFYAWYGDVDAGIDADGLAACAAHIEGLQGLSRERVGQEMLKLLAAPDPAPALSAMGQIGALAQVLPAADANFLPPLIHLEQSINLAPDPLRRLAVIGGIDAPQALRLSKAETTRRNQFQEYGQPAKLALHTNAEMGRGLLAILKSFEGQEITDADLALIDKAATAVFPLKAQDLMPELQGQALGEALYLAEERWVASGFTLTKDELLG